MKKNHPGLSEQYMISYPTNVGNDIKKFRQKDGNAIKELDDKTNDLLAQFGDSLKKETWDVLLVDAPGGCSLAQPGRFGPMFTSKNIVDRQGHGHIFVDDYQRDPEKIMSDVILDGTVKVPGYNDYSNDDENSNSKSKFGTKVGEWYRIHPASRLFVETMAMFSFGKSDTDELKTAIRNLDGTNHR